MALAARPQLLIADEPTTALDVTIHGQILDLIKEALSYYLGKVLECASFCAEPYGGKETVLGEITEREVRVTAMHPEQRGTVASVAGHAMYERSNPFHEYVAGG
jgi:alpha-D-ribose 1-methylphosphonate 5-triphosphate synthase subunit PhnL